MRACNAMAFIKVGTARTASLRLWRLSWQSARVSYKTLGKFHAAGHTGQSDDLLQVVEDSHRRRGDWAYTDSDMLFRARPNDRSPLSPSDQETTRQDKCARTDMATTEMSVQAGWR